jgi:hypothetical protein
MQKTKSKKEKEKGGKKLGGGLPKRGSLENNLGSEN